MRVFLTGATGFIGSRIVPELISRGHHVVGLTRSEAGARLLEAAGAEVHRGTLEDPETLSSGASAADAVIHTAFDHTFTDFKDRMEKEKRALHAMGAELAGSDRPFIITSGTGMGSSKSGAMATEDVFDRDNFNPRVVSELVGEELSAKGVSVAVVRLPQVHDTEKQGLITPLIAIYRKKGVVSYVGDGTNRWPAAHVTDVARLYGLALDRHEPGARYHAVAEEGVAVRAIADVLGAGLGLPVQSVAPEEAEDKLEWMARFAQVDLLASSAWTRQNLHWEPVGPDLLTDLRAMNYAT